MTLRLKDQVAIVTGAGRGIGEQIALDLAHAGAAVGLIARTEKQLSAVAANIEAQGGRAIVLPLDISDRPAVEDAVCRTEAAFGPVSVLVNNAGYDGPYGPIGVADPDEWWSSHAINVRGALLLMHATIPTMRARREGRIINMVSGSALGVVPGASAYCVGKSTLLRLTEHVAEEIKDAGLFAFATHPGVVITEMARHVMSDPAAVEWVGIMTEWLLPYVDQDQQAVLRRIGSQVLDIACGRYDALAGRYLDLEQGLDATEGYAGAELKLAVHTGAQAA